MYTHVAWNRVGASRKSPLANNNADAVKWAYNNDSLISAQYNAIAGGKWNHMMDQTHIGYTYWQQPPRQRMPEVKYVPADSILEPPPEQDMLLVSSSAMIPKTDKGNVFYEEEGYVSIEADHYTKAVNSNGMTWKVLPDHGRTGSAITVFPVTAVTQTLVYSSPKLEYDIYVYDTGNVKLQAYFSPTLNFHNDEGLKYAIAIDDELPQVISINKEDNNTRIWEQWVANNIIIKTTNHNISKNGKHIIKFWLMGPCAVLQKIVLDFGGVKQSFLGPPETIANQIK